MKPKYLITIKSALLLCIVLFVAELALAQIEMSHREFGTLQVQAPDEPCITPVEYAMLEAEISANVARLAAEGNLINAERMPLPPQTFDWPLTNEPHFLGNDYFFIQNYVDHNNAQGSISDYMCGTRSYDLPLPSTYDHQGTDICIGPFWWKMMDDMKVRVIAAAPGQIIARTDGAFDRRCGMGSNLPVNSITIQHEDGTRALYWHMKNGSVTTKGIGDFVTTGEYLGYVGSSGSSTNPHLHFEVQDSLGNPIDPWQGPCNPDIVVSRWNSQKPYPNSGIMSILTLSGVPSAPACPGAETVPLSNHFDQGSTAVIEMHLRDLVPGTVCLTRIYNPGGGLVATENDSIGNNFFAAAWFRFTYNIPNNSQVGTYRIQVDYQGKKASHYFTVGCPAAYNLSGAITGYKGYITGSNITTTQTVSGSSSNNIWYEAEDYIQANVGFRATSGCKFRARIADCDINNALARVVTDNGNNFSLKAFPSVASDQLKLSLELDQSGTVSITIYDLTGRKVKTLIDKNIASGTHEFDLSVIEFNPGVYICTALSGESKAQCKIVVQK